jgi:predicted outer membrane protein
MRSNLVYGLMLMLPLVTYTACSDDDSGDDSNAGAGGRAGASSGGRAGASSGGRAGASSGGRAGASSGGRAGANSGGRDGAAGDDTSEAGNAGSGIGGGGTGGDTGTGGSGGFAGKGGAGGTSGAGGFAGKGGAGGTSGAGGFAGKGGAGGTSGAGGFAGKGGAGGTSGAGGFGGTGGAAGGAVGGGGGLGGSAGVAGGGGSGGQTAQLSNAQVVKVLATVNEGEVAAAQAAVPSAQAAAVKNYATEMIADHSAANAQTLALVSTKHIAPQPSGVSEHLDDDAAALLATLSQTPQGNFDHVYIQSQVTMHQEVLTLIDTQLLPSASDPDLKALTTSIRISVAMHLQTAQQILTTL